MVFFLKHLWAVAVASDAAGFSLQKLPRAKKKKHVTNQEHLFKKKRIFQSSPTSTPWKLDPKNPEDADVPHVPLEHRLLDHSSV